MPALLSFQCLISLILSSQRCNAANLCQHLCQQPLWSHSCHPYIGAQCSYHSLFLCIILKTVLGIASQSPQHFPLSHLCCVPLLYSSNWCDYDPQIWKTFITSSAHDHGQCLPAPPLCVKPHCL
jgi:hypothetical protein